MRVRLLPPERWVARQADVEGNRRNSLNPSRVEMLQKHGPSGLMLVVVAAADGALGGFFVLIGIAFLLAGVSVAAVVPAGYALIVAGALLALLCLRRVLQCSRARPEDELDQV
jgi:Flp pilus assembly protein TadB